MQLPLAQSAALSTDILYGIISALLLAILALTGLWVRAHDAYRQWSTERINSHERTIALLDHDFADISKDLVEIKGILREHMNYDRRIHAALVTKLGLVVEED